MKTSSIINLALLGIGGFFLYSLLTKPVTASTQSVTGIPPATSSSQETLAKTQAEQATKAIIDKATQTTAVVVCLAVAVLMMICFLASKLS